jgi:hypothetical protein
MYLPDFERFEQISEDKSLTSYRNWRLSIEDPINLISDIQEYVWNKVIEGPHEVLDSNSGIDAYNYNYYYNYNYNNYNNNNYNYYYYNNNNYNYNYYNNNYNSNNNYYNNNYNYYHYNNNYHYYNIAGIIHQYGRVAIHKIGQRSEYAKIKTLFTIKESDAIGPKEFLCWISKFNLIIAELAKKYECDTIHYQDFKE